MKTNWTFPSLPSKLKKSLFLLFSYCDPGTTEASPATMKKSGGASLPHPFNPATSAYQQLHARMEPPP